jgi:epoxyqueuosine reductase
VPWRDHARAVGFVRVGVAALNPQTLAQEAEAKARTEDWVQRGCSGALTYMHAPRSSPPDLLPGAKSVIVAVAPTDTVTPDDPPSGHGQIAAYARGLDYHQVLKAKLWHVAQHLADELGAPILARVCVDTAPILERFWAECAGVTFTGKSTMAIAPGVGTSTLLALLLVDVVLPASSPLTAGCGECTLCLDACPTQAFAAPFVLDAARCLSFLTIENAGEIPEAERAATGNRVFGCDECQSVCPYNASRKRPGPLTELAARPATHTAPLHTWATLTSGDYKRLTKNSALRRAPRAQLQRNAVVALGNVVSPTPDDVAVVRQAAETNPSPLVRKHAVWALMRLEGTSAVNTLRALRETEPDASVVGEIDRWLTQLDV